VRFYVTAPTLEEAKRVIAWHARYLKGIRVTPNLLPAVQEARLTGLVRRFFEACAGNPSMDSDSFFGPYISGLLTIARAKGIELFNEDLAPYGDRQEVVDTIAQQLSFEEWRYREDAKSYEAVRHDIVLWYFVKSKRPTYVESAVEAGYWIVTVDHRVLAFDRHQMSGGGIAVCMHPAALTQMLELWVPRGEKVDEAILASLRIPLFFYSFDPAAEEITVRILRTLSRFENVGDIPVETVAQLVLDESLRERMRATKEAEEEIELVREALVDEQKRLERELAETKQRLSEKEKEAEQHQAALRDLRSEIERERLERELAKQRLEDMLHVVQDLEKRLNAAEEEKRRREEAIRRAAAGRFVRLWVWSSLGALLSLVSAPWLVFGWSWRWSLLIGGLALPLWLLVVCHQAARRSIEHPIVETLEAAKRWIWGVFIVDLIGNVLVELLKGIWSR
jgi:hypothetical protein